MGGGLSAARKNNLRDSDEEIGSPGQEKGNYFSLPWGQEYTDPPIPITSKPIGYKEIEGRTKAVKFAMKQMMKVVNKHSREAVENAKAIPVSRQLERVQITDEIIQLIKMRQARKDDLLWVRDNLTEIQGDLAIRRAALKMLNHNYSDVEVLKVDPIQPHEARTILVHKGVDAEETKSPSPNKSPAKPLSPDKKPPWYVHCHPSPLTLIIHLNNGLESFQQLLS